MNNTGLITKYTGNWQTEQIVHDYRLATDRRIRNEMSSLVYEQIAGFCFYVVSGRTSSIASL